MSAPDGWRRRAGRWLVEDLMGGLPGLTQLHPGIRQPERLGLKIVKDLAYLEDGLPEHTLDVVRPLNAEGPLPIVLYFHGGGFRILSKETHTYLVARYARAGFLVFNINYRLSPKHPFPAAIEDACAAYTWVATHAEKFGGDLSRLIIAGESAGGNLVAGVALAATQRRPEAYAQRVFETGVVPLAAVAVYPWLQVSDSERFVRKKPIPWWLLDRAVEAEESYLGGAPKDRAMADPLVIFEAGGPFERKIPTFFVPVGTADLLLDDSRRLEKALRKMNIPIELKFYPNQPHGFHAFAWTKEARACWADMLEFMTRMAQLPVA